MAERWRPCVVLWAASSAVVHLAFRRGLWLPLVYPASRWRLTFVGITVYRLFTEERQRLWIKRAFQRFVSPEVVEQLVDNPGALQFGGEVRTLTVLFTDIRDFTTYTERHPPQEVVQMLREYLTRMADQVLAQQGTLDKFIGDAVMAIFGAPVPLPDHAERACRAALAMMAEMERSRPSGRPRDASPSGSGSGSIPARWWSGNLGSEQLFDYTVVGDGVNLGARLESLNKEYQTEQAYHHQRGHLRGGRGSARGPSPGRGPGQGQDPTRRRLRVAGNTGRRQRGGPGALDKCLTNGLFLSSRRHPGGPGVVGVPEQGGANGPGWRNGGTRR